LAKARSADNMNLVNAVTHPANLWSGEKGSGARNSDEKLPNRGVADMTIVTAL
jgi:hypothetical protein